MVYKSKNKLILAILEWVQEEHLAGKKPDDHDISNHFGILVEEAHEIRHELEATGELSWHD